MNLLNKIKALFVPTVDSIVADFNKTEKRLRKLATARALKAGNLRTKAAHLLNEADEHVVHMARATEVADKIGSAGVSS